MPNIPNNISIDIKIDSRGLLKLLLISIALEELSLTEILNSEGKLMKKFIQNYCYEKNEQNDLIRLNKSVAETLRLVLEKEKILQEKLRQIISFYEEMHYHL